MLINTRVKPSIEPRNSTRRSAKRIPRSDFSFGNSVGIGRLPRKMRHGIDLNPNYIEGHESMVTHVSPCMIAAIYGGQGQKDKAFEFLEKAYQEKSPDIAYFLRAEGWTPSARTRVSKICFAVSTSRNELGDSRDGPKTLGPEHTWQKMPRKVRPMITSGWSLNHPQNPRIVELAARCSAGYNRAHAWPSELAQNSVPMKLNRP